MRIGLLTGGGDCPGLNAAIRAIIKRGIGEHGVSVVGFRNGWQGVIDGATISFESKDVSGILTQGGTILGTARLHPHQIENGLKRVQDVVDAENLTALICIGGDGTLNAAAQVAATGVRVIGIPKTIDNDVVGTDVSIGFDTARAIATEAIDRLHTTAESHNRVMVVELMGRHCGWIAVTAGIAGGADIILTPEEPFDIAAIARRIQHRHHHKNFSIVAVAEGAVPAVGSEWNQPTTYDAKGNPISGQIGQEVTRELHERTGFETRLTVLGYVQRGGIPTAADRLLGTQFGIAAIDAVIAGETGKFTALRGNAVELVSFDEMAGKRKYVPESLLATAKGL